VNKLQKKGLIYYWVVTWEKELTSSENNVEKGVCFVCGSETRVEVKVKKKGV